MFVLTGGVFLASLYLTPIFLQQVLRSTGPIGSGTTTFVEVIGVAVGSQTLGRLYPRFGPRVLVEIGATTLTVYMALFVLVSPGVNMWLVRALMFFGGVGNAGAFLSIQTSMFTHISSRDTGHASAIYNTILQSSIALDIAVLTTVVAGAGAAPWRRSTTRTCGRDPLRRGWRAGMEDDQHRRGPLNDGPRVSTPAARPRCCGRVRGRPNALPAWTASTKRLTGPWPRRADELTPDVARIGTSGCRWVVGRPP